MSNNIKSIVICGVGGQGILLTSTILGEAALLSGLDVKKNEVHGMAQRGGSVISQIRYGTKVFSPLIPIGTASIIISFEKMEALRYLPMLDQNNGIIILNDYEIPPAPVLMGKEKYPDNIKQLLSQKVHKVFAVDAYNIAKSIGNTRMANIVMLGAASEFLDISQSNIKNAMKKYISQRLYEQNVKAFDAGVQILNNYKLN